MNFKNRLSLFISRIAHPIVLVLVLLAATFFSVHSPLKASLTMAAVTAIGILPLIYWNQSRTKKGIYTNFDVSVRKDRYSMFVVILVLTILVIVYIIASDQPRNVLVGSLVLLQMLVLAFIFNFRWKISLHMAVACYVALAFWQLHTPIAILLCFSTPFIAWSRKQLGRHQNNELVIGGLVGLFSGILLLLLT
ncbi:hypothetical protein SAMN04488057_115122 [Cyclobacterium lianum]|uniref:PAP2 superfamily protein n=1 Tax=Cyclobacterium lianum TaxID=388280 RepID=A0A1M7QA41_9BACT|nr:hypothetical protein [Cyclobacterium lianum]SHN27458.1 hypothetical protein SAMN04488057_115122 [Cyclobacterium lianum]